MSNKTIIERIELKVIAFEDKQISGQELSDYLNDSIESLESLEGLDYSEIQTKRDLQYKIEICGFSDEDDTISDKESVISEIRIWLKKLKEYKL